MLSFVFSHTLYLMLGCLFFIFVELCERATTVLVKRMANCLERY
jgi:hypothetical protein